MNAQRNNDEEEVKQFISDSLRIHLIRVFSPDGFIVKNEGKTKFAYQDNIGQFLREAERLHIPPSDLFQTVDLLEGKRMQSVITCLLAIQRIMRDRKLIPNTIRAKKKSNNMLFLKTEVKKRSSSLDLTKPSKDICKKSPLPSPPHTRRNSSEALTKREEPKLLPTPPIPVATPSKSTPTSEQINSNNRKTSLKKMGACAIAVQNEDGTQSVYALGKSIGKGQFGEVFGGLNMDTGEYVAIKRIKRNQMDCDDM
ncbi:Putative STE/STE11/CDC15 protein kinase [Rhizopus microsporus]|nr:Putative STE/STE11/CDC15 protein kinase [Rhizopus microsporus]